MFYTSANMRDIIGEILAAKKEQGGVKSLYFVALHICQLFYSLWYIFCDATWSWENTNVILGHSTPTKSQDLNELSFYALTSAHCKEDSKLPTI